MANTLIQIKRSLVTDVPSTLNIAEPAYSYSSNTLFIGTPDSAAAIEIGGYKHVVRLDKAYNHANSTYDHANAAFANANGAFAAANGAYLQANSGFIKTNSAFDHANAAYV